MNLNSLHRWTTAPLPIYSHESNCEINNNINYGKALKGALINGNPKLDKENHAYDDGYSSFKEHKSAKSYSEMQLEIATVKRNLKDTQTSLTRTHAHIDLQQDRMRKLVSAWKQKVAEGEQTLEKERALMDMQLQAVTKELAAFEGNLKKEQTDIYALLKSKDTKIHQQAEVIDVLLKANNNLATVLKKTRRRLKTATKENSKKETHKQKKPKSSEADSTKPHMNKKSRGNSKSASSYDEHHRTRMPQNFERSKSLPNFDLSVLEEEPENVFDETTEVVEEAPNDDSTSIMSLEERLNVSVYGSKPAITRPKSDILRNTQPKVIHAADRPKSDSIVLGRSESTASFRPAVGQTASLPPPHNDCSSKSAATQPGSTPYKTTQQKLTILEHSAASVSCKPLSVFMDGESRLNRSGSLDCLSTSNDNEVKPCHVRSSSHPDHLSQSFSEMAEDSRPCDLSPSHSNDDIFEITWSLVTSPNSPEDRSLTPRSRIQKPRDVKRRNRMRTQSDASHERKADNPVQTKRYQTSII